MGWVPVTVYEAGTIPAPSVGLLGDRTMSIEGGDMQESEAKGDGMEGGGNGGGHEAIEAQPIRYGPLRCMSLGFLLHKRGDAVIWRGPKKTAMVRQFLTDVCWGETDYLLIDTPPGTSDEHIALAQQLLTLAPPASSPSPFSSPPSPSSSSCPRLAGGVLVTTPQAISTADVRKEINFCMKTRVPALGVIENLSGYQCPCCGEITKVFSSSGGEVMAREMEVPFLGTVPVDVKFGAMVERRRIPDDDGNEAHGKDGDQADPEDRSLVHRYLDCPSQPIFERVAKRLITSIEGVQESQID
jgi:Mrp family chromosome partitioning ATPase